MVLRYLCKADPALQAIRKMLRSMTCFVSDARLHSKEAASSNATHLDLEGLGSACDAESADN